MQRVYAIVDGRVTQALRLTLADTVGALLEGGLRLLQLRWKDHWTFAAFDDAKRAAHQCRDAGAILVINDRADIAQMLGAGVHVGQEDLPAAEARRIAGADSIIGVSTHNETQFLAACAEPVDYIALGPMYATASKQNPDPVVGVAELARLRPFTRKPLVAIGGIKRDRAPEVWRAGADSVAVIADLFPADATLASIRERAAEWAELRQR